LTPACTVGSIDAALAAVESVLVRSRPLTQLAASFPMRSASAGYAVASFQYVHIPVPLLRQIASCASQRSWSALSAAQVLSSVAFRYIEADTVDNHCLS
jgi:hypothetical protein